MDNNNWRAAQGQVQIPGQFMGGEAVAAGGVEGGDWRTQLQPDLRHRIVNKIMDTLKRHLPFSGQGGLQELKNIAVRFEEKIYAAATSQLDYLRRISLKILTMETKSQNPMANSLQSNGVSSTNPQDPGLTSALPYGGGMSQGTMCNVPGTNPSMRNMSNVNQNAVGNSLGQSVPSNIHANSQRQIQASLDLSQTSNVSGGDWQDEIYLKIKSMNEMYSPELNEMYLTVAAKLQQHDAYPQQPKNEQLENLRSLKVMLEHLIAFLQTKKQDIQPHHNQEIAAASEALANIQKQVAMMSLQEMNIN